MHTKEQYQERFIKPTETVRNICIFLRKRCKKIPQHQAYKLLKKVGSYINENVKTISHMEHGSTTFRILGL
jgi:hypothetical protein